MAEHTSLLIEPSYLMDQRVVNARLDRLESSLEGISRAMDSLTQSVDRLLHAVIGVSDAGSDAQMPAPSPSFCHHQQERLTKDQEEKEHENNEEAHLYTIIKVTRDEDLARQIGRDIYFDLVDHDKVKCFRVKNQMPFIHFKDEVAKEFGIPVQFMRFWLWAKRANFTYRPHRPVTRLEETQSVGQLRKVPNKVHNAELKLFLEAELGPLYDPEKEELRYVGRLFVKGSGNPLEILTKLNEMAGYHPEEEISLFEEIKFEPSVMCEPINMELSYSGNQLEDGDIICFQKAIRFPDVPSYLTYLRKHRVSFIGVQLKQCVCLPHV